MSFKSDSLLPPVFMVGLVEPLLLIFHQPPLSLASPELGQAKGRGVLETHGLSFCLEETCTQSMGMFLFEEYQLNET